MESSAYRFTHFSPVPKLVALENQAGHSLPARDAERPKRASNAERWNQNKTFRTGL
ncbi:MAG: hypothetical protein GY862_17955 [Gammaproteobacteria bacterium]|nr:hypothetical protein [Gammaproteobacteria bacterium]